MLRKNFLNAKQRRRAVALANLVSNKNKARVRTDEQKHQEIIALQKKLGAPSVSAM